MIVWKLGEDRDDEKTEETDSFEGLAMEKWGHG